MPLFEIEILDAMVEMQWYIAVPKSYEDEGKVRGILIGDEGFMDYVTGELPEEYEIVEIHSVEDIV